MDERTDGRKNQQNLAIISLDVIKSLWMIGEDLQRDTLAWYTCPDRCINVWLRPEDHQLWLENFYASTPPLPTNEALDFRSLFSSELRLYQMSHPLYFSHIDGAQFLDYKLSRNIARDLLVPYYIIYIRDSRYPHGCPSHLKSP